MPEWKFALRSLSRRPGFLLTSVLLLTLGVGAGAAFFSVVDTVLLKPLPYPAPDRLVRIMEANSAKSQKESLVAPCRVEDWNRLSRTFTSIAGSYAENVTDTSGPEPERLSGLRISPRYFDVYGSAPALGRTFVAEEERNGGPLAVVISYGLWMRRFGGDPQAISRRLIIGGSSYSIVGVMSRNFLAGVDIWIPDQLSDFMMRTRDARFMVGVGRMKPGVAVAQARADLDSVQKRLGEEFPATDKDWSSSVLALKDSRVGDSAKQLLLLFGAVALLLLITTTNIAGLALADLRRRERELAVRSAIGASRAQVVLSVMREMAVVALAGGLGGWTVAAASIDLLKKLGRRKHPQRGRFRAVSRATRHQYLPFRGTVPFGSWHRRPARWRPERSGRRPDRRYAAIAGHRGSTATNLPEPHAGRHGIPTGPYARFPRRRALGRGPYPRRTHAGAVDRRADAVAGRGSRRNRQFPARHGRDPALSARARGSGRKR